MLQGADSFWPSREDRASSRDGVTRAESTVGAVVQSPHWTKGGALEVAVSCDALAPAYVGRLTGDGTSWRWHFDGDCRSVADAGEH